LDFDLDFVIGSSEVLRRHPPHHLSPARAKSWQGETPKRAFAALSHLQQCSNRARKPVKSEQDNCSLVRDLIGDVQIIIPLGSRLLSVSPRAARLH
jgi:hypothetical protein